MPGIKHLIQCHCILPQYRKMKDPLFHKFIVYSKINIRGEIEEKIAKCNNCNIYHKVNEICKSELLQDYDGINFIISIDDIEDQLPDNISKVLKKNNCDLPTWENILDIYQSSIFDVPVVISRNTIENSTYVKSLTFIDKGNIKIDSNVIADTMEILI